MRVLVFKFRRPTAVRAHASHSQRGLRMVSLKRCIFSFVLFATAGGMIWYSACTYRIFARDPDFLRSAASRFFPAALLRDGGIRYYTDLDAPAAALSFRAAIASQPSMVDAWMALARVETGMGHAGKARRIAGIIAPSLASISSWKWEELVLAFDLGEETYFETCFNFILTYLPHRAQEASLLGRRFWGGWSAAAAHLAPRNHPAFLKALVAAGQPDCALSLWKAMEAEGGDGAGLDIPGFCQFLIVNGRLAEAKDIWRRWAKRDRSLVHDGEFESPPLGTAFGWRLSPDPGMVLERTMESVFSGKSCLHVRFLGTRNRDFGPASQIVPVQPGADYRLRFARRGENLTTDRGVFLEVGGYQCEGLRVRSEPVLSSAPWAEEELEFRAPAGCEAVVLMVCRRESLKLDGKISGDYWLDAVRIEEK